MIPREQIDELKPFQARAIIEELRKGTVPIDYVPFFTVGRQNWLTLIDDDFENYIAEGGAKVRFINGDYGDGKTHFMSVVRHLALRKRFAVSFVVLTREVPLQKFEAVYREIVLRLRTPQVFPEIIKAEEGIRSILSAWAENTAAEPVPVEGDSVPERLSALREKLSALPGMDVNFANALAGLADNCSRPLQAGETTEERALGREILYQWFEGGKASKKDLKGLQIFETLNKTNSKRFLSSLIAFLKHLDCRGLILLVDELETVVAQSASVRNAAYENVRLLIDNTEQARFLHIFFSIIPDVILSEKGFKSYDALWSRVRSIGEGQRLNYRSVLIDLHKTPLETHELIELGLALRRIHQISYRWEANELVGEDIIEKICAHQKRMGLLSEVRLFIKQVIRILDMAEQGTPPGMDFDLTEQIVTCRQEMEQEKTEQLQPRWDT
ncbi:MAG: DUF2791 family P-loop domain-containing protein [Syntrophobacteraceae bacterium]|nr:DUF2791 family P-loop domain-containing protein [Syntrophobacteraceae bacterium]